MSRSSCLLAISMLLAAAALRAPAEEPRPQARAMRLPDGAIEVDGFDHDWRRVPPGVLAAHRIVSDWPELVISQGRDRGVYAGPSDNSMEAWVAHDDEYLYVLADVRDQLLINDATPAFLFNGDDFEIFLDVNDPEQRCADRSNDNTGQFVFLPEYVNPSLPRGLIWGALDRTGTRMASRPRPWGYTIEIAIPKKLLPNWRDRADMTSIGFDAMACDADCAGVDWDRGHPSLTSVRFLLSRAYHAQRPRDLALLHLGTKPIKLAPAPNHDKADYGRTDRLLKQAAKNPKANHDAAAQSLLDLIAHQRVENLARLAMACDSPVLREAALRIYAKRSEVQAPIESLAAIVTAPAGEAISQQQWIERTYALAALALREKLPAKEAFAACGTSPNDPLRITLAWALGENGDTAFVPELLQMMDDENPRVAMMAAMSLGRLGDSRALPRLQKMAEHGRLSYARLLAKESIEGIGRAQHKKQRPELKPEHTLPVYELPADVAVDGRFDEWPRNQGIDAFKPANVKPLAEEIWHDFEPRLRFGVRPGSDDLYLLMVIRDGQRKVRWLDVWPQAEPIGDTVDLSIDIGLKLEFEGKGRDAKSAQGVPRAHFRQRIVLVPPSLETEAKVHRNPTLGDRAWDLEYAAALIEGGTAYELRIDGASIRKKLKLDKLPAEIGFDVGLLDQDWPIILGLGVSPWKNANGYYRLYGPNRFFPKHGVLPTQPTPPRAEQAREIPQTLASLHGRHPGLEDINRAVDDQLAPSRLADLIYYAATKSAQLDAALVERLMGIDGGRVRETTMTVILLTDLPSSVAAPAAAWVYKNRHQATAFELALANALNERHALGYRDEVRELMKHDSPTVAFLAGRALAKVGRVEDVAWFEQLIETAADDARRRHPFKDTAGFALAEAYESYWSTSLEDLRARVEPIEAPSSTPARAIVARNTDLTRLMPVDGNNVYNGVKLLRTWPEGGPKELWRREIGLGKSGVVEADGRALTIAQYDNGRAVLCLDAKSGEVLWRKQYEGGKDSYGPMITPVIDGDRVLVVPRRHDPLICLRLGDGEELWRSEGIKTAHFATPLVVGERIFVCLDGKEPLAALNRKDGKLRWKTQPSERGLRPAPASPSIQRVGGIEQVVFAVGTAEISEVWGVRAETGERMWRYPCTSLWGLIPTPVAAGSMVFVCDGGGPRPFAACLQMYVRGGQVRCRQRYRSDRNQCNHINTPSVMDGRVYGFSGAAVQCTSLEDGRLIWERRDERFYGNGQMIAADGLLIATTVRDELALLEPESHGCRMAGLVATGAPAEHKQQPSLANGRLYYRGDMVLVCYQVTEP